MVKLNLEMLKKFDAKPSVASSVTPSSSSQEGRSEHNNLGHDLNNNTNNNNNSDPTNNYSNKPPSFQNNEGLAELVGRRLRGKLRTLLLPG